MAETKAAVSTAKEKLKKIEKFVRRTFGFEKIEHEGLSRDGYVRWAKREAEKFRKRKR